jgi:ABC-2 type transport system permease protein
MDLILHSWWLMQRQLRISLRQPWYVILALVQPAIGLFLYSQLLGKVVELPGFPTSHYIDFLAPGIIIMTAASSPGWAGMSVIVDMERGVIDRLLVSPVCRSAVVLGRLMNVVVFTSSQATVLIGLSILLGAHISGGITGAVLSIVSASLLAILVAALSIAIALLLRKQESIIGAVNLILLPLTLLSPIYITKSLMPPWMVQVAAYNPVVWSLDVGRDALLGTGTVHRYILHLGWLAAAGLVCCLVSVGAFTLYRRNS